jgi:O-antigen ligase
MRSSRMRSSVTLWTVMALLILTLPFNPVLNRPGLALAVFVVAAIIAGFAFNVAMVEDIENHVAEEDEL